MDGLTCMLKCKINISNLFFLLIIFYLNFGTLIKQIIQSDKTIIGSKRIRILKIPLNLLKIGNRGVFNLISSYKL